MSTTETIGNEGSITQSTQGDTQIMGTKKSGIIKSILPFFGIIIFLGIVVSAFIGILNSDPLVINPTGSTISFEIDNVPYSIAANTGITLDIKHGTHTVTMSGKNIGTFDFGRFDGESVINPTMSEFVVVDILYGDDKYSDKLTNNTIMVRGNPYTGPYTLIEKSLYLKKDWDYGAYEASPDSITTKAKYKIEKELFMIDDFIDAYYHDNEERAEEDTTNTSE